MKKVIFIFLTYSTTLFFYTCTNREEFVLRENTNKTITYNLENRTIAGISGTAIFKENPDASVSIVLDVSGTSAGDFHPAFIYVNSAAEGGAIAITLAPINGDTGTSTTTVTQLNDSTSISYAQLLDFDGHIGIHSSIAEIGDLVAEGDIGQNVLTENKVVYDLSGSVIPVISGNITFSERKNGAVLASIRLSGTPFGVRLPANIYANTVAEGGDKIISLNHVHGDTGRSDTNLTKFNNGKDFTFAQVESLDAYVNTYLSTTALGIIAAQGDIGQNDLTGNTILYDLGEKSVAGVFGHVLFSERKNGESLAVITLTGTPKGGKHLAHIHASTVAEGGGIIFEFNPIDGNTGISVTNVAKYNYGSILTYNDILSLDAYINVHLSNRLLGTILAEGDIGQNDLTGENKEYVLHTGRIAGIYGIVTFHKRLNGTALIAIKLHHSLQFTKHPAHLHYNTVETGGAVAFALESVDGATGISKTHIERLDNDTPISYDELLAFNGYINVHIDESTLGTVIAKGNIGANE